MALKRVHVNGGLLSLLHLDNKKNLSYYFLKISKNKIIYLALHNYISCISNIYHIGF